MLIWQYCPFGHYPPNFNMKKIIVLIIANLCSSLLYAQNQTEFHYFNKTFWADSINTLTPAVQVQPDGYLLFGKYVDIYGEYVYMRKLDLNGNSQWTRIIDDEWDENQNIDAELDIIQGGGQVITTTDNHIVLSYSKDTISMTGTRRDVYLTKLDLQGNRIWQRHFGAHNRDEICIQVIQTADGGFMIVGAQGALNGQEGSRFYVVKTDSLGILEWENNYVSNWGIAFTVQQTWWDGGYIIGGAGYTDNTEYDMWVVKITATGTLEWERNYGGINEDCSAHIFPLTSPEEYNNGEPIKYLMTGCIANIEETASALLVTQLQ